MVMQVFPLAECHLFEPLCEVNAWYKEGLDELKSRPGVQVTVHPIALDTTVSTAKFGVSPDPMGSSLLATTASEWFPTIVEVETAPLDKFVEEHRLPMPQLIKIDTQGSELRILESGEHTLEQAEVLIIEAWLERGYGPATPLLHELVDWLARRNFLVIDFASEYRNEKGRLIAKDLVFARPDLFSNRV
jgi:FkbM family methyltransferase